MDIKRFEGNGRMSRAVVYGETLYLCGQTDQEGADVKAQTANVLAKIEALLDQYGSSRDHTLSATIYIKDMALFADMNSVWDAWIRDGFEPARACVEANMAAPGILVEISIVAGLK